MNLMEVLRIAILITMILAILYLLMCATVYLKQEQLIFAPMKLQGSVEQSVDSTYSEYLVATGDALLSGIYFTQAESPIAKGVVLLFRGNGGTVFDLSDRVGLFLKNGLSAVAVDYRGSGKSTGTIQSESQFYEDALRVYDRILENHAADEIVIYGHSLGVAPAIYAASQRRPRALLLDAAFLSMTSAAKRSYPFVPIDCLLKYQFDNAQHIANVKCKIYMFQGSRDTVFPVSDAEQLALNTHNEVRLFVTDSNHHSAWKSREFASVVADLSREIKRDS